jgi:hypothetical protein
MQGELGYDKTHENSYDLGSGPICTSFFCAMYISNISLIGLETF